MKKIMIIVALFTTCYVNSQVLGADMFNMGSMTTAQMNAITVVQGLQVGSYVDNLDTGTLWRYNGTSWVDQGIGGGSDGNDFVTSGSVSGQDLTLNVPNQTNPVIDLSSFALDSDLTSYATQSFVNSGLSGQDEAVEITNSPSGNLSATNVQGALDELQTDIDALSAGAADGAITDLTLVGEILEVTGTITAENTNVDLSSFALDSDLATAGTDDQTAAEVTVTASGNLTSTDVQAGLEELQADVDTRIIDDPGTVDSDNLLNFLGVSPIDFNVLINNDPVPTGTVPVVRSNTDFEFEPIATMGTDDQTLAEVLTEGNSVGSTNLDMNQQQILNTLQQTYSNGLVSFQHYFRSSTAYEMSFDGTAGNSLNWDYGSSEWRIGANRITTTADAGSGSQTLSYTGGDLSISGGNTIGLGDTEIFANFAAGNYTPVSNTLRGQLQGIDAALGSVGGGSGITVQAESGSTLYEVRAGTETYLNGLGAAPANTVVQELCDDCPPASTATASTLELNDYKVYDDRATDATTFDLSNIKQGAAVVVEINRASVFSITGATPTNSTWADGFTADTRQLVTFYSCPSSDVFISFKTIE